MPREVVTLRWVVATLKRFHGLPPRPISRNPFHLILYQQVGYLVSEDRRRTAFARLQREVGLSPEEILAAPRATLRAITAAGGSIAAPLRAERLRASAERVIRRWNGDLGSALALPIAEARRALAGFPMIGPPGADRILAITGAHAVLGLDSNGLRVCLRLGWGKNCPGYAASYRSVQEALGDQRPRPAAAAAVAAALLRLHGETICRRGTPDCLKCPLARRCPYPAGRTAVRRTSTG